MQIKESEFYSYKNIQIIKNDDNGLYAVEYEPDKPLAPLKFEKNYSYYGKDCYSITVDKPTPRRVLRTVIAIRTSVNCYRIAYADVNGCAQTVVKALSEVHEFLTPLWERKLKQ